MPTITDWIMVGITTVYVIATIAICSANIKSARSTKQQLDEIKRQFDAANRPIIEVEFLWEKQVAYGLRFVNRGKHTAQHVCIQLNPIFTDSLEEQVFREQLLKQGGRECVIGVDQHYDLFFGSNAYRQSTKQVAVDGLVCYEYDGQKYQNEFSIDLPNYMTAFSINSTSDSIPAQILNLTSEVKGIKCALEELQNVINKESSND